jgi:hypothetical protein
MLPPTPIANATPSDRAFRARNRSLAGVGIATNSRSARAAAIRRTIPASSSGAK